MAVQRVLAQQFRIAQNHFDVAGEYVSWENLSQTQKEQACERLGITLP